MIYDKSSTIFLKERIKQNAGTIKNFADKIGMKPSKLYSRLSYKTYFCLGDIVEIGNCLTMSCPEESEACFFFSIDKEKNCYFNIFKAFTDRNISFELVSEVLEISIGTLYLKLMGQTPFTLSEVLEIHETFVNDIPLEKLTRTGGRTMRACTTDEIAYMLKMLDNHNEFDIIKAALSTHEIVTKIDEAMAYVCDRFISELLDDYLNDDTAVGTAFILGIMQGKRLERMKNSGKRTTASRRI